MAATADIQRLLSKADWPQWFNTVSRRARRDEIWDYCNPALPEAADLAADPTASVHQELIQPTRPRPSEIKATATQLSDLSDVELKRWAIIKDDYNDRQREYT